MEKIYKCWLTQKLNKALCRNRKALSRKNKSAPRVIVGSNMIIKALCTHFKIKTLLQMILQNILEIQ